MFMTAQRVISRDRQHEGTNTFLFTHQPLVAWVCGAPPALPEQLPLHRIDERVTVPPNGNRVRSFLDLLAEDHTPSDVIRDYLHHFLECHAPAELPATWAAGACNFGPFEHQRCWFRLNMEVALTADWDGEARHLLQACLRLREPDHGW